jgi:hypothetical protein
MTTDRPRRRNTHPLVQVFPAVVMAVATFLVIFAVLMARVSRGTLEASAGVTRLSGSGGPGIAAARTRTSGGAGTAAATPGPVGTGTTTRIVARTSGSGGSERDDG